MKTEVNKEILYQMYVIEKRPYRFIMKFMGINNARRIKKLLTDFNIEIRHGSEAVKTQWINAEDRKHHASIDAKIRFDQYRKTPCSESKKKKISAANAGSKNGMYGVRKNKHPCWLGGSENWSSKRKMSNDKRKQVFDGCGKICNRCGETKFNLLTINHIIPYRICRTHDLSNLEVLCKSCHFSQPVHIR